MKKIKVSTVKMMCDAQVINIDAHLVANAIKAQMRMQELSNLIAEVAQPVPAAAIDFVQEFLDNLANAFLEDGDEKK